MQNKIFLHILAATALGVSSSLADTITLKSGKVLEGKVLEESATEYILEVQITSTIKDRKTVKKTDVESIVAEAPDLKPYEALKNTLPTPDQLSEAAYRGLIEPVRSFVEKHPKSEHIGEVKKMLAVLEEESKRVEAGDVKLSGQWIPKADWDSNAYELDAQLVLGKIKLAARRGQYRQAMLASDELSKSFPFSEALNESEDIAKTILPNYLRIISAKAATAKEKFEQREKNLNNLPSRDAKRVKLEIDAQTDRHNAEMEEARESRTKWLPENDFDEKGLKNLERSISTAISSLSRPARDKKNFSQLYRDAWVAASKGDVKTTEKIVNNLRSGRVADKYMELLEAQLEANPAPEPPKEEPKKAEPKPEPVKEKPKKTKSKKTESEGTTEVENESSMGLVYGILGLAIIGILVGLVLKNRKSDEE
jgi:hypothetical protein